VQFDSIIEDLYFYPTMQFILEWYEKNLVVALRELESFMRLHAYYISGLETNGRDGEYIIFTSARSKKKIVFILTPGFDIVIKTTEGGLLSKEIEVSLIKEREIYPEYSQLPVNFKNENDLSNILKKYKPLLEIYL